MIFKRRNKLNFWERLQTIAFPRKGWRRGFVYIGRRVQRLPDTPHRIALGFACGAMASFTPFFMLHTLVAVVLAYAVRGNLLSAALGTIVGNPITFPLIAGLSLETGNWLLGRVDGATTIETFRIADMWERPAQFMESIFTPYLLGGVAPGVAAAIAAYFLLRPLIARFQSRRRAKLARRADRDVRRRAGLALRSRGARRAEGADDPEETAAARAAARARRRGGAQTPTRH